ncbi:MAG: integrin [Acidobacteria bacterium]|nr:integrin [Acidobacteriota bacterium]
MLQMNRRHERRACRAAAVAALLLIPGHLLSQAPGVSTVVPPMLPLKQVAYIKASNTEAYDHFACGGGNQGHTGNSIALSADGGTMAIGAPFESGGSTGINGNQSDNSTYASGAVYVFTRQGDAWTQQAYVKASNPGQSDHFGSSVTLSRDGNTMAVAAHWESSAATGINGNQQDNSIPQAGAAYLFTRTGGSWAQQAYIKASNTGSAGQGGVPGDGDQFGFSIALSGDGQTLAVGAITEDSAAQQINGNQNDDSTQSAGAVYVFSRTGSTWAQQAYLKDTYSEAGDLFGFSVGLSFDGNTLAAAAFDEDGAGRTINSPHDNRAMNSGALYVFTRQNGGWSRQAYIKGSRGETSDGFGFATSISEDGNTIAVGAGDEACLTPGIDPPGCADDAPPQRGANVWVGAAYVFVRNGATWTEQAFIKANNARPYNSFGVRLALSGDGSTLAVTAALEDNVGQGVRPPMMQQFLQPEHLNPWREHRNEAEESGAVYVFTRSGILWTAGAYVKGSNAEAGDEFGSAVALSGDGRMMVAGAHQDDSAARGVNGNQADNSTADSGAAYVFVR